MKKILIVLLMIAILIAGCAQEKQNPSANDSVGNSTASEVNVDPNAEQYTIKSTLTSWESSYAVKSDATYVYDYRGHNVYVVAEVTNLGDNPIFMSELAMEGYALTDGQGITTDSTMFDISYPVFLMPGETGYLYGVDSAGSQWTETPKLSVIWQEDGIAQTCVTSKELDDYRVLFEASDVVVCEENGDIQVKGIVSNNTKTAEGTVYVTVALFDKQERFLGLFVDMFGELAPEDNAEFVAVGYPTELFNVQDVASWKIEAYSYK